MHNTLYQCTNTVCLQTTQLKFFLHLLQINIDFRTREETKQGLQEPTPTSLNLVQSRVYCLMEKDSYPRFLRSKLYQDLLNKTYTHCQRKSVWGRAIRCHGYYWWTTKFSIHVPWLSPCWQYMGNSSKEILSSLFLNAFESSMYPGNFTLYILVILWKTWTEFTFRAKQLSRNSMFMLKIKCDQNVVLLVAYILFSVVMSNYVFALLV